MRGRIVASLALAAGLAVAVGMAAPRPAATTRPDTIEVTLASGACGWIAWPPGTSRAPGLIVLGASPAGRPFVRAIARRLARHGYVALAPESRTGVGPEVADLQAALDWLRSGPRTAREPVGVLALGDGVPLALDHVLHHPEVAAMVLFDGHGEPGRIADVRVPIQWHVGRDDDSASERVGPLRESLRVAGRRGEVHVYPGAARGFFDESAGGAYHPDAARQAWVRALAFFQTHLRSGS